MSKTYHSLAGSALTQDWSNTGLITADDNWAGVPSIEGFLGQGIATGPGADPRTLLTDSTVANDLDVIADQTDPDTLAPGGVAEFDGIANPTIALSGSATADAPHLVIYLDTTGVQDVRVRYTVRDIEGSTDSADTPVALQYRIGESGPWTNIPAGFVAHATQSNAGRTSFVDVALPSSFNNHPQLQLRIITADADGTDEWVSIDDIIVSAAPAGATTIRNDQIDAVEGVVRQVVAADGVLTNDSAPGTIEVREDLYRTAGGGQVYFKADGSYDYISAAGFSGNDTVQYTVVNLADEVVGTGTLTINVTATAHLPFVSVGAQLSDRHVVESGFGQIGNGVATNASTPVVLRDGGYVVVLNYLDQADGSIQRVQTYDPDHNLVGALDFGFRTLNARAVALPDGGYVVSYGARTYPDPNDSSAIEQASYVQRFDATGHSLSGPTQIDVPGSLDGISLLSALPDGGFVLLQTGTTGSNPNSVTQLYAQSFNAAGVPEDQQYTIGAPDVWRNPTILPNGEIVVTRTTGSSTEPHLQRFDVHGNPIGAEIDLPSDGHGVTAPRTFALAGGGFVAMWMSNTGSAGGRLFKETYLQIVDADGNLIGAPTAEALTFTTLYGDPTVTTSVTPLANGGFVVRWRGVLDGDNIDRVQAYDANANAVGTPFETATQTTFGTVRILVYALPDGGYAVTLQSANPANHNLLIYDNSGNPVGEVRMHDAGDGTGHSSFVLVNRPNGDTLVENLAFGDIDIPGNVTDNITIQTIRFDGTVPAVETGVTFDTTAKFPVAISIPDPDGSEYVQSIDISGVPVGWTLSAPSGLATLNAGVWTVTGLGIQHGGTIDLVLTPPGPVNGSVTLSVVAHTIDTVNGSQNQSFPAPFNVTLQTGTVTTGTSGDDSYDASSGQRFDGNGGIDTITFGFKLTEANVTFSGNQVIVDGPNGSHTVLTGFEVYKFSDGTVNNNDGDRLVDDLFYYSNYHDAWINHIDADGDYHLFGWKLGRDPNASFSTSTYLSLNPDVKASGGDPLAHFDNAGWKEGRAPSIDFDPAAYLAANPDVKTAGVDPLRHYLEFGYQEGRQPVGFDHLLAPNGFDYVYYLQNNPDVAAAHVDPLQHFQTFGWKEGRNPNALFDVSGYLAANADVKAAGVNPLDHFNQFGWHEGRDPSVYFDVAGYLGNYADIAAAQVNPLNHFLTFGPAEGRSAFADYHWG